MNRDAERLAALLDDLPLEPDAPGSADLADLLVTARAVRALEPVPPPPGGLSGGRAAFVAAGVRQAQARPAAVRRPLLGAVLARYRLAPVALVLATIVLGGVVTTARAQSSLPGDALYSVKRLTESVHVAMVRGEERASLQADLQQRRRVEAQELLARRRSEPVRFEGLVTALADGRMTVDGLVVDLDGHGGMDLALGVRVLVEGITGADGVLRARVVRLVAPVSAPLAVADLPAPTPVTRWSSPEPTSTSRPATATPIRLVPTPAASAPPTALPTALPSPSAPPPVVAGAPRVRERQIVEWEGALERVGPEWWVVGGQAFYRPTGRVNGDPLVCSWVRVRAERKHDRLELVELRVIHPAAKPEVVTIRGTVEVIEAEAWVIDGQRVLITGDTVFEGKAAVGSVVRVTVQVDACGRRLAQRIEVDGPRLVEFMGVLQSFGDDLWVVDGRSVQVTAQTVKLGQPWIGAMVRVRATEGEAGVLVALELVVLDTPPTVTPGPTAAWTATPPAAEPAPLATPTSDGPVRP